MARIPAAEVAVDTALVTRLLAEQHPDLLGRPLAVTASGWDNVMVRLGSDLAVRVPRRAVAARLVEHEQRVLPRIAGRLPVAVPTPVRVGRPTAFFPWPWSIVPWLEGTVAADIPPAGRDAWAPLLADALAALHEPADADAPANPFRGVPLAARRDALRTRMAGFAGADALRAVFDRDAGARAHAGAPRWVHGDPHPLNLLCADDRLSALLDFGDVTGGDPATDLATAWLTFTAAGRSAFVERYAAAAETDAALWRRARAWAAGMAAAMLAAGDDHAGLSAIGTHAVAQVLGRPET